MTSISLIRCGALLAAALAAAPAAAQSIQLLPESGDTTGTIRWRCGDEFASVLVELPGLAQGPGVRFVVWQFDKEVADTTFLVDGELRSRDRGRFTTVARSASRLTLDLLPTAPGEAGRGFSYALGPVRQRLSRLQCPVGAVTAGRMALWPTPEGLVAGRALTDTVGTKEIDEVDALPSPVNGPELARLMQQHYPRALRDSLITGDVTVRFRLMADGRVDPGSIQVIRSTDARFSAVVVRYLPVLLMRPARVGGRAGASWAILPIRFRLSQ